MTLPTSIGLAPVLITSYRIVMSPAKTKRPPHPVCEAVSKHQRFGGAMLVEEQFWRPARASPLRRRFREGTAIRGPFIGHLPGGRDKTSVPRMQKGTEVRVRCSSPRRVPHAGDTTQGRSDIPWAEKWPAMRYCGSVAIWTLLAATGRGHSATAQIEPFAAHSVLLNRGPSVAPPHPPNGRARAKAPAVCWGFRLTIPLSAAKLPFRSDRRWLSIRSAGHSMTKRRPSHSPARSRQLRPLSRRLHRRPRICPRRPMG